LPVIQFTVEKRQKAEENYGMRLCIYGCRRTSRYSAGREKRISSCPKTCLNKIGYEGFFGRPSVFRRTRSFFTWE